MRIDLWQAAAELADPPDERDYPRPRYTPQCQSCYRFVPKGTTRSRHNVVTGETVELGDCSRCGTVEVD